MALPSCCKTSLEKKKIPAEWCMASRACRWAVLSRSRSSSRCRNDERDDGAGCALIIAAPDVLSNDNCRWAEHLLQRGRFEKCADASAAARTAVVVAHVRAPLRPTFGPLSPRRARLSRLRT